MFIVPLFLGLIINPKGLNARAEQNRGISVFDKENMFSGTKDFDVLEEHSYIHENNIVIDDKNYYSIMNKIYENINLYKGKKITVIGFVYKDNNFSNDEFVAARMMVSCCAADAEVIGFICKYSQSIKLTGVIEEYTLENVKGGRKSIPLIIVEKLANIEEPSNQYIYP